MNRNILIFCLLLAILNCNDGFCLSIDMLISGSSKYKISLFNKNEGFSDNDLFYSGTSENIETILVESYNKEGKAKTIKDKKHPLVFMLDQCLCEYIKFFSTDTIFIINEKCINKKDNYSDYTIFSIEDDSNYFKYLIERERFYYVKIGKDLDMDMRIFLYIIMGLNMITSIFLSFIMKRVLRNMDEDNILIINFLICHVSDLLFMANIGSCLSFFFFMGREALDFLSEYIIVFLMALYKGSFYTIAILLLKGWMTTTFISIGDNFKKYYKRFLIYELLFSLLLQVSVYFINFTSKLNLFYIKNELEQIAFMIYIIYCFIKKLIPLYKQINYEQRIRSELVECLTFKYKKLFKIFLLFFIYSLWTIISPLLEKKIIYSYIYNYHLHCIFQLFYEVNFCLGINIIFIPKELPRYFFDEIIYNYRGLVLLIADVYEEDDEENHNKKLNITKLSYNELKKAAKKENYPIVLINPFASSRDQLLFNHIHIGNAQKNQKN